MSCTATLVSSVQMRFSGLLAAQVMLLHGKGVRRLLAAFGRHPAAHPRLAGFQLDIEQPVSRCRVASRAAPRTVSNSASGRQGFSRY